MSRNRAEATSVATSQELLRGALHRSQRRNTWVARRRLAWRWTTYLLGRALVYLGPPLMLAAGAAWWWRQQLPATASAPRATPMATASAASSAHVPDAAPMPSSPAVAASAPLQLRLDDEVLQAGPRPRHPRLPLRPAEAASAADTQE
jgi:hypothetical protein